METIFVYLFFFIASSEKISTSSSPCPFVIMILLLPSLPSKEASLSLFSLQKNAKNFHLYNASISISPATQTLLTSSCLSLLNLQRCV